MKTIQEIRNLFQELTGASQEQLLDDLLKDFELKGQVLENVKQERIEKRIIKSCPHCSSTKVHKRGKQKNVQMYRCQEC
ncbi:MAG: hypothetical protein KGZ97_13525, partial [Bacteroidetes bacterium]|nr:hypothetical protein [Bacteroidota bacterium]